MFLKVNNNKKHEKNKLIINETVLNFCNFEKTTKIRETNKLLLCN